MDKEKIETIATKFSEKFAISMFQKYRKFCKRGLTHLDATSIFKNRPNTYGTPCTWCKSFPEPSGFQYSERTIASTETNDTSEESLSLSFNMAPRK